MESELIQIFDEHQNELGVATRNEVHKVGYWHKTFHCWFISREAEKDYIHFQIRSKKKKDFPNLLDITAAGHILAHESILDGIREVEEELGIAVSSDELIPLGVMKDSIIQKEFIDHELCNVFLYKRFGAIEEYKLQHEEVAGIVKAEFQYFYDLCFGQRSAIESVGFIMEAGERQVVTKLVSLDDFVPHEPNYLIDVASSIRRCLE